MKACPTCYRLFPADAAFCAADGTPLQPADTVSAQPAEGDRFLGTVLCGRYEFRRVVADGGMGRVYEARDLGFPGQRRVAIKLLHPEVARDPIAVERFRREFEISKDLPHEHIVEVYDYQDISESQSILVMEFLDGEELRAILKRDRTLRPARVVRIMSQVAIALDEAHRREFVHRDLKPDNIFLCGDANGDVVKLLDFGSVRINKNRATSKLTSMGTTIGSPYYMSPEQAQGAENLDRRADVFALGAISYEALCGQVPFPGNSGPSILLAILTKNPAPITTRLGGLPPALDDVLDDALAKKPETRTATAGVFADALGHALGLAGDHLRWAKISLAELEAEVATATGAVAADPFVADPFGAPVAAPMSQPAASAVAMSAAMAEPAVGYPAAEAVAPAHVEAPRAPNGNGVHHVDAPLSAPLPGPLPTAPAPTPPGPPPRAPQPSAPLPSAPLSAREAIDPRLAMDAAFEAANEARDDANYDVPGISTRTMWIWLVVTVAVVGAIVGYFAMR